MKAARKPRNSKVHATDEEPPPAGLAPPMGSPGTGQPKGAAGGAKATLGRKKKDDEPKGPGVLNAKTYEQRESTVTKLVEDVDVAKHEDHSGALAAFLDLLGIRKDAPVVPQNASAGAVLQRCGPTGARGLTLPADISRNEALGSPAGGLLAEAMQRPKICARVS